MSSRRRRGLGVVGLLVVLLAVALIVLAWPQVEIWLAPKLTGLLAQRQTGSSRAEPPRPLLLATRTAIEGGRVVVKLSDEERERMGVKTAWLTPAAHRTEIQAFGSVLDIARITDLTNAYASAKAALLTAQARAEVSRSAYTRAKSLGQYATQVQVETSEGTFRTDEAALAAAQSQVRTLAATAQQEWGTVLGKAIVERSPVVTRLIERADFLVQVTLPPGETFKGEPGAAFAEVPPQSERVALRYVSAATRTDQRIQGLSSFYLVSGDSGLLPGMSTLVFLTSDKVANGVAVPESAVVHWQGGAWIYRAVGDDAFARHAVKSDAAMADDSYVVSDLDQPTEVVVIGPQAVLSEEVKTPSQPSGDADDD